MGFLAIRLWGHNTHGVRVMCHSAVTQSHQICSVQHLCVPTYSPTWFLQYFLTVVPSHLPFIPMGGALLMGQQFLVLLGPQPVGLAPILPQGCGVLQSHIPWLPATSFGWSCPLSSPASGLEEGALHSPGEGCVHSRALFCTATYCL